jgi:hypothetical protein
MDFLPIANMSSSWFIEMEETSPWSFTLSIAAMANELGTFLSKTIATDFVVPTKKKFLDSFRIVGCPNLSTFSIIVEWM